MPDQAGHEEWGQQKLHEMKQRREFTRGQVSDAPRVTGGPESGALRVERAQEGQDAEITAMHARGDGEYVSVSMKRGAEKASSFCDDRSRKVVTILLSLDWVLMNFRVAEVFCEDRFSDAVVVRGLVSGLRVDCSTGWVTEDERHVKEVQ